MNNRALRLSNYLLVAVITVSTLLYLLVDFGTYDVIPTVRIYGAVQLLLTLGLLLLLLSRRETAGRTLVFGILTWLLLAIQVVPAVLWFAFDGSVVAEYPWDGGIAGSWVYGAYHLIVIVWGVANMIWRTRSDTHKGLRAGA